MSDHEMEDSGDEARAIRAGRPSARNDMDFGRQPKPVMVTLFGEPEDVAYWKRELFRRAEFKGDMVVSFDADSFHIYPRAVND